MGKRRQNEKKKQEQKRNQNFNKTRTTSNSDASKAPMYPILEENKDDHISNLPDEILYHILSLLPFESALQTSYLSTRWNALLNIALVQHGTLNDIACAVDGFLGQVVNNVIDPLRNPRRLQFHFNQASLLLASVSFDKLHLDFSTGKQESARQFDWNLDQSSLYNPFNFIDTLHLTSLTYLTSDTVSSIVSKLQLLKNLKISKCVGLRSLRIGSSWKLRDLTVLDCSQLKFLYIIAPRLLFFQYRGPLPWFSFDHFSSVKYARLDFRRGPGYNGFTYSDLNYVLSPLYNLQTLTLCKWTFEAISHRPSIKNGNLTFNYLTKLWWIDSSIQDDNIQALISFLSLCTSLERLFIHIDPTSYSLPNTVKSVYQVDRETQLSDLKVVRFEGFMSQEDEILLAARLLEIIPAMPLIIATTHGNRPRRLVRMSSNKTKQMNKKSDKKVVEPRGRKYSYRFVEEVEDIDELCSKHAHMSL